jgi:DNA-binding response OmpR family regulator
MLKNMLRRNGRLLVLDDDTSMQKLVSTLLRKQGFRVDVFGAGRQAIESLNGRDYDALLLDVMTPTEGGLTVIRHLREHKPEMLRRVLLVTASPDSVLKGVASDVFGIVHKPFRADELIDTLNRLLAQ